VHRSLLAWTFLALLVSWGAWAERPNILWITSEDNGPHLGCYGDTFADTPNLDAFAARSTIYLNAWSTLPVCAPARTAIITGMYPSSIGAQHMRSMVALPPSVRLFPEYLREAGYYCTNAAKEDYNVPRGDNVWDESSRTAHWKNRDEGQPFFAVFNIGTTHESQIRRRPHTPVHDPADVTLPAHYPDTAESRQDWAQYYDKMTEMDAQVGEMLRELEEAGLADDTIVMYYGDHGVGLPRSKRSPYNSGLRVPLIVHVPEKYRDLCPTDFVKGGASDRLVSFVDLAPTLLMLAGIEAPKIMQGQPFLGGKDLPEKDYMFGMRGRMDERPDMIRVVRDKRYLYMKNFMPHRPHGQFVEYMFQTPSTRAWYDLYQDGKLEGAQAYFWERRDSEELYDLEHDPDEVRNLAGEPEHRERLDRMRDELKRWQVETRDVVLIPEPDYHTVYGGRIMHDVGKDELEYPLELIQDTAFLATAEKFDRRTLGLLEHENSMMRYWGVTGLLYHAESVKEIPIVRLRKLLEDHSPSVRVASAELLGKYGAEADVELALETLVALSDVREHHVTVAVFALNALDALGEIAAPVKDAIAELPNNTDDVPQRYRAFVGDLKEKIASNFE
jgi:uncharacterized sulfatase